MATQPHDSAQTAPAQTSFFRNPWVQLVAGLVAMISIANLQYGWTLFVEPLHSAHGWTVAAIQVSFSIFVLLETWLVPFETYLADRFGAQPLIFVGGIFTFAAWAIDANASSLGMLYLGGAVAGIGGGLVYGTCMGNTLKWFTSHRGLAAGLTAAGFGAGAALTVIPISRSIASNGYSSTFMTFAVIQGLLVIVAAIFIRTAPHVVGAVRRSAHATSRVIERRVDSNPGEVLRSAVFWVMYVMFTCVAVGGLFAISNVGPIAKDYGFAKSPVTFLAITLPTLTLALSLSNITNGLTRVVSGWVSDYIGREATMCIVFAIEAIGIYLLAVVGHNPAIFILLACLINFGYGEIFSLFPSTTRDHFGYKYASTNYGILYTAKGVASLLLPLLVLMESGKNWTAPLLVAGTLNVVAAILAIAVLRPMREREIAQEGELAGVAPRGVAEAGA